MNDQTKAQNAKTEYVRHTANKHPFGENKIDVSSMYACALCVTLFIHLYKLIKNHK